MNNMEFTWEHTRSALGELENLLVCGVCRQLVQNPRGLGKCEHFFCSACIENSKGNACPECGLPSHVKDVSSSRQLETAVTLCQNLSFLLLKDSLNLPGTPSCPSTSKNKTKKRSVDRPPPELDIFKDLICKDIQEIDSSPVRKKITRASKSSLSKTGPSPKVTKNVKTNISPTDLPTTPVQQNSRVSRGRPGRQKSVSSPKTTVLKTPTRTPVQTSKNTAVKKSVGSPLGPAVSSTVTGSAVLKTPVQQKGSGKKGGRFGSPSVSSAGTPVHSKKNAKGETALHVAVIKGDYDRVRSMLEEGSEVNTRDHAGWTPLHEACNHGFLTLVELLLDHGAFVNIPGCENETPLHDAVGNDKAEVARLLISRGADKQAKNRKGLTPRELAKTDEMREILDDTSADSQLDTSVTSVPGPLAVGPVVLLATGLTREERARVQKCASLLHGQMVMEYCHEVTHLVTSVNKDGQCPRTLKFLQAVLAGKWIVNKEWVETCIEYEERISEEAFEVPGCSSVPDSLAPQRARLNSQQQLPSLFDGCHFFLQGTFEYPVTKPEFADLIKSAGGNVLSRLPKTESIDEYEVTIPYHAQKESILARCSHYVVYDTQPDKLDVIHPRLCHTTASWLMNCIAKFEILDKVEQKSK